MFTPGEMIQFIFFTPFFFWEMIQFDGSHIFQVGGWVETTNIIQHPPFFGAVPQGSCWILWHSSRRWIQGEVCKWLVYTPRKPTGQMEKQPFSNIFNRRYIFIHGCFFHCHVGFMSFPGCIYIYSPTISLIFFHQDLDYH